MSEPGFKKWYVTECSTSDCWCRCIGTAPDSDDMQDYIVPSGSIHRADAEQVVAEHNERPDLLKTIAELRRELAEAQQKIAVMQSLCDSTSGLYKYFEAEAGRLRERVHEAWVDIGQWCQLARYQREKMDQNLGWCPTQAGIDASTAVKEKISAALATPAVDATPSQDVGFFVIDGRWFTKQNGAWRVYDMRDDASGEVNDA